MKIKGKKIIKIQFFFLFFSVKIIIATEMFFFFFLFSLNNKNGNNRRYNGIYTPNIRFLILPLCDNAELFKFHSKC